jgi:peptide/nickel transport system substrate-binding protein
MTSARACFLAASVLLVTAASADSGSARPSDATPAAAPFAAAWANVPHSPQARKARNIVVFAASTEVPGFNTALTCCNSLWADFAGADETLHGAFNLNNKGEWFKDLVSNATATKTTLSYTIKPNAYWYWGGKKVPVTYKDFVYTLQQIDNLNNDLAGRTGYANLDATRFTHKGDKQVTFFWKTKACSTDFPCGPYANWQSLFSLAPGLYPSFALQGLNFNKIWTTCICGFDGKPVSDGPFYLANYTPNQGTTLKANPYWSGKKPGVAEVDFKFITDSITQEEAMRNGEVDAIAPAFGQYLLPLKNTPGITFDQAPGYVLDHLEFREGNATAASSVTKGSSNVLLRAPWMREAIALGINRQAIINNVFGPLAGSMTPQNNLIFYSTQKSYRPDFQRWNYNPTKALAILKAHCAPGSGPSAPNPANTKTWQCSGLPATFNWTWRADIVTWTTTEQIVKAELRSIGIAINEQPLPANAIFGPSGIPSGDYDIAEFTWIAGSGDPTDWYEIYRCRGDSNYTGYCSHTVDSLLKAANAELNPVKRAALYQQADALMATEVPMLPLYQRPVVLIHRSDLLGMVENPAGLGPFWNIEDWHWKS